MRHEIFLTTALTVLVCQTTLQTFGQEATTATTAIVETDPPDMKLMNETKGLLQRGNEEIRLEPERKHLTLLLGLSGSGKSTMTQLISGDEGALIAYRSGFDTLIRDTGKKISQGNNTLKSQTLFPEMFVDNETNDTLYDCPGFQDTRTTPIEIANGFFMKKLVKHATTIKLLVVAKYDGLKSGGSRAWFPNLMIQLFSFVKSFKNYQGGVALLATKVDFNVRNVKGRIAHFLKDSKGHILEKLEGREGDVEIVYDAWLKQDAAGNYVNMEFFEQPDLQDSETERLLRNMTEVNANRARIRQMIFNNTHFQHQPCNASDFGIPLSHKAVSQIQKIEIKLRQDITTEHQNMATAIRHYFGRSEGKEAIQNPNKFSTIMGAAKHVEISHTAEQVSKVLVDMVVPFGLANVASNISGLTEKVHYRQYLDELQSKQGPSAAMEYTDLLKTLVFEIATTAEYLVRSNMNDIVDEAFSAIRDNVDEVIPSMKKSDLLAALETTVQVVNGCTLNSYDFQTCVGRTLERWEHFPRSAKFGLKAANLQKAAGLDVLLSHGEDWAEPLQKVNFLQNLNENIMKFGEHVGKVAGIKKRFPHFGKSCDGDN